MRDVLRPGRRLLLVTAGLGAGAASVLTAHHLYSSSHSTKNERPLEQHGGPDRLHAIIEAAGLIKGVTSAAVRETFANAAASLRWRDLNTYGALRRGAAHWTADMCKTLEQRVALVRLGGPYLLDWLLELTCAAQVTVTNGTDKDSGDEGGEQQHAEHALTLLLSSDVTASTLLMRPGAVPRLLHFVGSGQASQELATALESAAKRCRLQGDVFLSDLVATIGMVQGGQGEVVQHLAALFLASWADGSAGSRQKLAGLGLHQTLARVTAAASGRGVESASALQWDLIRVMRVLLAKGTAGEAHHLACCVEPALYVAADAAVAGNEQLTLFAVDTLAACAAQGVAGGPVQQALLASSCSPLLRRLTSQGASRDMQRSVVQALSCLARARVLPKNEVPWWRDWLLDLLCGSSSDMVLKEAIAEALQTLCSIPGTAGLQTAHYWLARLLQRLADRVSPYNSVVYSREGGAREPEQLLDAVPVLPHYVKSVAQQLERASDAVTVDDRELPPDFEMSLAAAGASKPAALKAYRAASRVIDAVLAEKKVCEALDMLCAMVAANPSKQQWLASVGVLPLLQMLCMGPPAAATTAIAAAATIAGGGVDAIDACVVGAEAAAAAEPAKKVGLPSAATAADETVFQEIYSDHDGVPHLLLRRQTARLLALLALHPETHGALAQRGGAWRRWLKQAAHASDCRLSSHATKALLNLEAYSLQQAAANPVPVNALTGEQSRHPQPPQVPPVFYDMVHLLNPGDPHHWLLTRGPTRKIHQQAPAAPSQVPPCLGQQAGVPSQRTIPPLLPLPSSTVVDGCMASGDAQAKHACDWQLIQSTSGTFANESESSSEDVDMATLALTLPADWIAQQRRAHIAARRAQCAAKQADAGSRTGVIRPADANQDTPEVAAAGALTPGYEDEPTVDVVFVHGIRGGPFITWRTVDPTTGRPAAAANMTHAQCWPSAWMADDLPKARLLTVEYLAPVSGWEGESLPLEDTVSRVCNQLLAAGVGSRPVVFVTHSMGGLLVKEILARGLAACDGTLSSASGAPATATLAAATSMTIPSAAPTPLVAEAAATSAAAAAASVALDSSGGTSGSAGGGSSTAAVSEPPITVNQGATIKSDNISDSTAATVGCHAALMAATRGVVFYATPHFGSQLAAYGWKLRHLPGAAPAPSLARLSPGPHLIELNQALQRLYLADRVALLSFIEGQPTQLAGYVPKILIVPQESAYPGFGDGAILSACDHISVCKPINREVIAYTKVLQLIRDVIERGEEEKGVA